MPSLRELAGTVRAVSKDAPKTELSHPEWGPREATIFLGFVLVAMAAGMAGFLFLTRPTRPVLTVDSDRVRETVEGLSLEETFELWESMRKGLMDSAHPSIYVYEVERRSYLRRMSLSAAIGVVGLLVAGVGLAGFRRTTPRPRVPRARRASVGV